MSKQPPILVLRGTYPKVAAHIEQWNEQQKKADGTPDLKRCLRDHHLQLTEKLCLCLSRQLQKNRFIKKQVGVQTNLFANAAGLAVMLNCSTDSIYRYYNRLKLAGIITGKIFHGTNSNVEITLNPSLLCFADENPIIQMKPLRDNRLGEISTQLQIASCNHTVSGTASQTNSVNDKVDLLKEKKINKSESDKPFLKTEPKTAVDKSQKPEPPQNTSEGRADRTHSHDSSRQVNQMSAGQRSSLSPAQLAQMLAYVNFIVAFIKHTLYDKIKFLSKNQLQFINEFFIAHFEKRQPLQHAKEYDRLTALLSLIAAWKKRKPDRFIPIPTVYFSDTFDKGFLNWDKEFGTDILTRKEKYKELEMNYQVTTELFKRFNYAVTLYLKNRDTHSYNQARQYLGKLGMDELIVQFDEIVIDSFENRKTKAA